MLLFAKVYPRLARAYFIIQYSIFLVRYSFCFDQYSFPNDILILSGFPLAKYWSLGYIETSFTVVPKIFLVVKFNLEERLIKLAVLILEITEKLPDTKGSNHLSGQLVRSGTAPALHYGEAQSAESRKDFIHKMKIALEEMRESLICLKIIERKNYLRDQSTVNALSELHELISIFVKSIETAKKNLQDMEYSSRTKNVESS